MTWEPLQDVLGTAPVDGDIFAICAAGAALTVLVTELTKWPCDGFKAATGQV